MKIDLDIIKKHIPSTILKNLKTDGDVVKFYEEHRDLFSSITISKIDTLEDILKDFIEMIPEEYKQSFIIKGCISLKLNLSIFDEYRLTTDIDMSLRSQKDWLNFISAIPETLNKSKLGYSYNLKSTRGFNEKYRSDSIEIEAVKDNVHFIFSVDMNIKEKDLLFSETYQLNNTEIPLYQVTGMLADKLSVIATKTVCRRVKDLIDINEIINSIDISMKDVIFALKVLRPQLQENIQNDGIFIFDIANKTSLEHAYNKYITINYAKPYLEDILNNIAIFATPIFTNILNKKCTNEKWDRTEKRWE